MIDYVISNPKGHDRIARNAGREVATHLVASKDADLPD